MGMLGARLVLMSTAVFGEVLELSLLDSFQTGSRQTGFS